MSAGKKMVQYALVALFFSACAAGGLTRQDVLRQYDSVNDLSISLAVADGKESALLAPAGTEKAHALLEEAVEYAIRAQKNESPPFHVGSGPGRGGLS